MVERIRNVRNADKRKMNKSLLGDDGMDTPVRKKRKSSDLARRYPNASNVDLDNAESVEKHLQGISNELLKSRPCYTVIFPLMKSTYPVRRLFVLNEDNLSMSIIFEHFVVQQ